MGRCVACSQAKQLAGRQLCGTCYCRHRRRGTLDQFPPLPPAPTAIPDIGATYRQLDHWVRSGYLKPNCAGGSGFVREWPKGELRVANTMARLVAAGLPPALAARVARGEREIAPGVKVLVKR